MKERVKRDPKRIGNDKKDLCITFGHISNVISTYPYGGLAEDVTPRERDVM